MQRLVEDANPPMATANANKLSFRDNMMKYCKLAGYLWLLALNLSPCEGALLQQDTQQQQQQLQQQQHQQQQPQMTTQQNNPLVLSSSQPANLTIQQILDSSKDVGELMKTLALAASSATSSAPPQTQPLQTQSQPQPQQTSDKPAAGQGGAQQPMGTYMEPGHYKASGVMQQQELSMQQQRPPMMQSNSLNSGVMMVQNVSPGLSMHSNSMLASQSQTTTHNQNQMMQQPQQPDSQQQPHEAVTAPPKSMRPLYMGHNPYIEILRPYSYVDDNIVILNLSHSHIYEIDSDAFVGQRLEHIDLSNNKLGLIHSRSFQIGPTHSGHDAANGYKSGNKTASSSGAGAGSSSQGIPPRRPPPSHLKSVTIDLSHNPAILALPGAFDLIDVPNCLLNFTNSTIELKFGAFKKYLKEHPGHVIDIETVDCCEQEWLLSYRHNFVARTHCVHDPSLFLTKVPQQTIIDSCIQYVTLARHSMKMQGPSLICHSSNSKLLGNAHHHESQNHLTYLILGGTAMLLTSLSIYIIFYMINLKATFVDQMQNKA